MEKIALFMTDVAKIWDKYGLLMIDGTKITILIAIVGTLLGLLIGILVGVIKSIPVKKEDSLVKKVILKVVNFILAAYIEVFRSTPMMVQAMLIYYGLAWAFEIRLNVIVAALGIVSVNTGAYMAEIVRGGILSIDKGQYEAAHSIGMTHWQTMGKVVLPQAIRNIMPAVGNEFIINMKDSCVLSVISVNELFFQTKTAAGATYMTFQTFAIACVIYFILTFTITKILRFIERKMDGPDNYTIHGSQTAPEAEIKVKGR